LHFHRLCRSSYEIERAEDDFALARYSRAYVIVTRTLARLVCSVLPTGVREFHGEFATYVYQPVAVLFSGGGDSAGRVSVTDALTHTDSDTPHRLTHAPHDTETLCYYVPYYRHSVYYSVSVQVFHINHHSRFGVSDQPAKYQRLRQRTMGGGAC
jgi:hypothetical protein